MAWLCNVLMFVYDLGGKKKHHKELMAMKRRQRMINRGVDLEQINLARLIFLLQFSLAM